MAEIRAEMVASVLSVLVTEGDRVTKEDVLALLESMKMEIPILAGANGIVFALHVSEGDVVQEDDLIAVIG